MPNRAAIKIIQNRHFLTTTPEKSVRAVAAHMRDNNDSVVLVVTPEEGKLLGICTERDLAFKVLAAGLDPASTPVEAAMTANPQTISPEKPFGHALHIMHEGGFRHLPVVLPDGRPIGVLSSRDALGLEALHFFKELDQKEVLTEIL
ncbi:CBS domain-containing protein [Ferribacterium limneticum]|uniref:CBS domain-containing protein n=1 Tax=Ferribacterium limneticum TaxID=76259 RepID=UPI001CF95FC3|nr:CBS domain-containing protein [Ferribacterium limneticum]UCV29064.1 CBS domain-containing protein [Ferribacterium limneticum]UCV32982.1 CBS domain-containing protein [Ferribacterium limneticum]